MNISAELVSIQPFNEPNEYGKVGQADIWFMLSGDDYGDLRSVVEVRVFFTDSKMTYEQINDEARQAALISLKQILEHSKFPANPEEIQIRWR